LSLDIAYRETEREMAKKGPKKAKRDDVAAKVDRTIIHKAKFVAERKGVTLAELLSELLKNPVEREFLKAVREAESEKGDG
jgi:hypothetical protein